MGTFVIDSVNFSLDTPIKNSDLSPVSNDDSPYVCIVRNTDHTGPTSKTPTEFAATNLCFSEFLKNAIPFEVPNSTNSNVMTTYGGIMTNSWNGLNDAFPNGFIMLSPEQVIDQNATVGKTISFTVYNKNLGEKYMLNISGISTVLLYNDVLNASNPGLFTAQYTVYNASNTAVAPSVNLGPQYNLRYSYKQNLTNVEIPINGYITFSVSRTKDIQDIDVYLLISLTGITIAKPVITFAKNVITTTYEKQDNNSSQINIDIARNIAGDSIIDAEIILEFVNTTNPALTKITGPNKLTNNTTFTYNLPYKYLHVGSYSVTAKYSNMVSLIPSYFASQSSTPLTYTLDATVLSTVLDVSLPATTNYSYDENIIFSASVTDASNNIYANNAIPGTMTLHWYNAEHDDTTIDMVWDATTSTYTKTLTPAAMKLYTGETYSFKTTFVSVNSTDYSCNLSSSPVKLIVVNGLEVSFTDDNNSTTNTIGLTEMITVSLKINNVGNNLKTYDSILQLNGKMNVIIYNSTGAIYGNVNNISASYIFNPRNPSMLLPPGSYYAIFTFVSDTNSTNIVVASSAQYVFTVDVNKIYILGTEPLSTQYGFDLTINAVIKSNDIILTREEISGGVNKNTDIQFKIYKDGVLKVESTVASYNATTKTYLVQISTLLLIDETYIVTAIVTQTSTNIYTVTNSANKSVIIAPQSASITIQKPVDNLSVSDRKFLYDYSDDVYVDATNYIFEYYWNASFTITGTISISGAVTTNNINGTLELWLQNDNDNGYHQITGESIITNISFNADDKSFTLTVSSPSALGITAGSSNRQFYIKWVPTYPKLFNPSSSSYKVNDEVEKATYIRSMKIYTIFNAAYNCLSSTGTITYEMATTFVGQVISYKQRSTISDSINPSTNTIDNTPVQGTYELKYYESDTTDTELFKSFGGGGSTVTNSSSTTTSCPFNSSLYVNGSTTQTLTVGTYYVRMFFIPTDTSQYYKCYSSITKPIVITPEPILQTVSLKMFPSTGSVVISDSELTNNTPVYLSLTSVVSAAKSTVLSGKINFYVGAITNPALYTELADLYTVLFTSIEKKIPSDTSITFIAVFTPNDTNYAKTQFILQKTFIKKSLTVISSTMPSTANYETIFSINCSLTPFITGNGTNIQTEGIFYIKNGQVLLTQTTKTISNATELVIFSGTPKDLLITAKSEPYIITVVFTPTDTFIGSSSFDKNITITTKQIAYTTITINNVTSISKSYDEPITINAKIPNSGISGNIIFSMIISETKTIGLGTSSIDTLTGIATLDISGYDFSDIKTDISYTIVGAFIQTTDKNYADGQTTQNNAQLTFTNTEIYLESLSINTVTQTLSSTYYKSGISVRAGGSVSFVGRLKSSKNPSKAVKFGSIRLQSNILSSTTLPQISINPVDGTFSFTQVIGAGTGNLSVSTSYYLKYIDDTYYTSRNLSYTYSPYPTVPVIPGKYYINVDEIPYVISMNRTAIASPNYTTDYHNGNIEFNVEIDQDLSTDAKSYIGYGTAGYTSDKKGGIVFMILNKQGTVIYRYEKMPSFKTPLESSTLKGKTYATWSFNPRTLDMTGGGGLSCESYNMKCYFEGIPTYYRSQDATYVHNGQEQYTIPFTIIQTEPVITASLTRNSVYYKDQPYLNIKIQTPLSFNNILGVTTLTYALNTLNSTPEPLQVIDLTGLPSTGTTLSTTSIVTITNIIDTKIVRMPIIRVSSYNILIVFNPTDNINYSSKSHNPMAYIVNKYSLDINSISIKPYVNKNIQGSINDERVDGDYDGNLINYDEPIEVSFNINKDDRSIANDIYNEGYESIAVTNIVYNYKTIIPENSTYVLFTSPGDFVADKTYKPFDSKNLKWTAVIKEQLISYINSDINHDYTLQIIFTPVDIVNYEIITKTANFAIYIASNLGTLTLSKYFTATSIPLTYNKQYTTTVDNVTASTFTIGANVQYLSSVDTAHRGAKITLYYDNINTVSKILNTADITNNGNYPISFSVGETSKLLTARNTPYKIFGILNPNLDDYPSIEQSVAFDLEINPSVEITINGISTNADTPPSAEYNKIPFEISAKILTGNPDRLYGGTITFTITNGSNISYTKEIVIPEFSADNRQFSFLTDEPDTDGNNKYDLPIGLYTVSCAVVFTDNVYDNVSQNTVGYFKVIKRTAPFKIELTKDRIIYGDEQPTIKATFTADNVYAGTIKFMFTHKSVLSSHNIDTQTYTVDTTLLTQTNVYEGILLPSPMYADEYIITAEFSGNNFDKSTSSSIAFIVSKKDVSITPTLNYYYTSISDNVLPDISATILNNLDVKSGTIRLYNITRDAYIDISTYTPASKTFKLGTTTSLANADITMAGSYEIAMYYNGDDTLGNFNKSSVVFTNLIVKRLEVLGELLSIKSSPTSTIFEYEFYVTTSYINANDHVELYSIAYNGKETIHEKIYTPQSLLLEIANGDQRKVFKCPDTVFNKGDTEIYAIISNSNYTIKTSYRTITKLGMNIDVFQLSTLGLVTALNSIYNSPFTIIATLIKSDKRPDINDGRVVFYIKNDVPTPNIYTTIGSANVINNVATLNNVLLTKIGLNKICAMYMDSFIYNNYPTSGYTSIDTTGNSSVLNITNNKTTTTVTLTSNEQTSAVLLTSIRVIEAKLSIDQLSQSGTMKFIDGSTTVYDFVPVINGVATIKLYVDKAYNLTAIYSGNEYLNPSSSSLPLTITLATLQDAISTHYEFLTASNEIYGSGTTKSLIITANITAKSKNVVYDNNGYFTFNVGTDERIIYAKGNSSNASYTATSSYTYTGSTIPSYTIDYNNSNYSGTISQ